MVNFVPHFGRIIIITDEHLSLLLTKLIAILSHATTSEQNRILRWKGGPSDEALKRGHGWASREGGKLNASSVFFELHDMKEASNNLSTCRVEQNNSYIFEFPAFMLPINLGQPIHSPLALTEHVSLNLAGAFLLDPVSMDGCMKESSGYILFLRYCRPGTC